MDAIASIVKQAMMARGPIPDAIVNAPTLEFEAEIYAEAFGDLTTERLYDGGPIPVSAIEQWCDKRRLSAYNFSAVIREADIEFMKAKRKKLEQGSTNGTKSK